MSSEECIRLVDDEEFCSAQISKDHPKIGHPFRKTAFTSTKANLEMYQQQPQSQPTNKMMHYITNDQYDQGEFFMY